MPDCQMFLKSGKQIFFQASYNLAITVIQKNIKVEKVIPVEQIWESI
jgi:hypothetical protein